MTKFTLISLALSSLVILPSVQAQENLLQINLLQEIKSSTEIQINEARESLNNTQYKDTEIAQDEVEHLRATGIQYDAENADNHASTAIRKWQNKNK